MGRLRIPILGMVVVIVAFAMAFAALRSESDLWYSALYTLTTFLLLVAVIAARFGRGNSKAFWFGFAVFGWGFFLLGLGPWTNPYRSGGEGTDSTLNRGLLTSRAILFLVRHVRQETDDLVVIDKITTNTLGISHLLMTLTLAFCGGTVAALMRRRGRRGQPRSVVTSLAILTCLALTAAYGLSGEFARPSPAYFPNLVFDEQKDHSDFVVEWYSKHLNAMGEISLLTLSQRDRDATVYRLLWLPSFDHPVCVRIDRKGKPAKLRAIVLDGLGGYEPGQVAINKSILLSDDQWREFDRHLEAADFWQMPTRLKDDGGSDGDQLVVEGVKGGTYHVVDRWEPDKAYAELCQCMLNLSGLKCRSQWEGYHSNESNP